MDNPPFDVRTACVLAHEYFTSLLAAGFNQRQAAYLTASVLAGGPKPLPEDDDAQPGT